MRTVDPAQHARKRARILHAAAEEFAAHGVDGTSTAAVCRRAGIGSGTLFHYFATKRDLFHAVFADDVPRNAAACDRALAAGRPGDGLDGLVDHLLADLPDPLVPGLLAAALLQANRDEEFARMVAADEARIRATLVTLAERLADEGRPLAFPPARVAGWIQRMVDSSYLSAGEDGFDAVEHAAELRRIIDWLTGRTPAPAREEGHM
ncbi:TetR/AcrR family transcriptional regulator [Streptomyces purpurogeneiscleroticus]|uniref:TetR/AcrR family transcriptional regulator n=1 Tax=Streptomyces purpurogeneiscleroticus TaxID=68259 RepID=UPI001CBE0EC8|nr:TetR/AcrR family transcriptional regulator [Streptomyces purpurogeneiscleroticus]MBZ4016383.1 TetR family transcriptional regulator [Streptomyces purpurogeneiscleroticus]